MTNVEAGARIVPLINGAGEVVLHRARSASGVIVFRLPTYDEVRGLLESGAPSLRRIGPDVFGKGADRSAYLLNIGALPAGRGNLERVSFETFDDADFRGRCLEGTLGLARLAQVEALLPSEGMHSPRRARARVLSYEWHEQVGQRRRGTIPSRSYGLHPDAVADMVASVPHTEAMLCASHLHDVLEDTARSLSALIERKAAIQREFGMETLEIVVALSDLRQEDDRRPRAERKAERCRILANQPAGTQTVKVADVIHNTADIAQIDPKFAGLYLRENQRLVAALTLADANLRVAALAQIGSALKTLSGSGEHFGAL